MLIKIKKLHKDAVIPFKTHSRDFCCDCVAISEEEVAPNIWKYGLGFAIEIDPVFTKYFDDTIWSIDVRPRSSIWKTGMVLSNSQGTVDEQYRGEISAIFYHIVPNMPRYKVGDRVCQIKLGVTSDLNFIEVEELSDTTRGTGGFGSTGR